jgi:hypothetical protein
MSPKLPGANSQNSASERDRLARAGLPSVTPPDTRPGMSEDEREDLVRAKLMAAFAGQRTLPAQEVISALVAALNFVGLAALTDRVSLSLSPAMYRLLYPELRRLRIKASSKATRGLPEPGTLATRTVVFELPLFRVSVSGLASDSRLSYRDPSGALTTIILPPLGKVR